MEPFSGSVEFLEDVLHHTEFLVHPHLAVVLPAALIGHLAFGILAGDAVMIATPPVTVHGVNVTARWIGPVGCPLLGKGIGAVALIGVCFLLGIVVWIACHPLRLAVDEELVDLYTFWGLRLKDAVLIRGPVELKLGAATQHGTTFIFGLVNNGALLRTGIRWLKDQCFGQIINAIGHMHGDGFISGLRTSQIAGACQRGHGLALAA